MNVNFETLEQLADEVGGDVRANYSGRGMYGRSCAGIVLEDSDLVALGAAIAMYVDDVELRSAMLKNTRTDSMGMRTIAYWPSVQCDDADEDEEDEDF